MNRLSGDAFEENLQLALFVLFYPYSMTRGSMLQHALQHVSTIIPTHYNVGIYRSCG